MFVHLHVGIGIFLGNLVGGAVALGNFAVVVVVVVVVVGWRVVVVDRKIAAKRLTAIGLAWQGQGEMLYFCRTCRQRMLIFCLGRKCALYIWWSKGRRHGNAVPQLRY